MSQTRQIFQTKSKWRWRSFQWGGRFLIAAALLMIPIVVITLSKGLSPILPTLSDSANKPYRLAHPVTPLALSKKDLKRYKGFTPFLLAKQKNDSLRSHPPRVITNQVRAAFYVDWDPQAFYSLQRNIKKLNMVVPEWFFINPATDTLMPNIDTAALHLMKKYNVTIVPLINNINVLKEDGDFNGALLHRILHNPKKQDRLINDIVKYIRLYNLNGINIDFEEMQEKTNEPLVAFQKKLYDTLHSQGLLVTQDVMPENEDFNLKELANYNDYLFLMAYDEHYSTSVPGPVSSQKWIEKMMDETAQSLPSNKVILSIAGYGYDWSEGDVGTTITYQQALATAKQFNASIDFDNDNYNDDYTYKDADGVQHSVYFTDAITNFNTIRFADEYGTAGTALWRLGSEDERLWTFYNRSLDNNSLQQKPFDFSVLQNVTPTGTPDFVGDGEVLSVITAPSPGKIKLEVDTAEGLVSEEVYEVLPTNYVIKKYGNVKNQVLLTFDDGPDPTYTPQIIDILNKEKVPAAFFMVGIQAENNLPLVKTIYNDGYEIGNHTFTHPNIAEVSSERALNEIETTRLLIEAITGRSTVLFRAPFNADAEPTTEAELRPIAISKQKNYYTVEESIDPNDWEPGVTADSIYQRVVQQYEFNPSKGIILLHDAGGNRQATVDALPRIIKYFKNKHVQFISVADLLRTTKDVVMPPVSSNLIRLNGSIATVGYWSIQFINAAFWTAILLGLFRIALMAVMAFIQQIKNRKNKPLEDVVINNAPFISIVVPAYNEEINAVKTIDNLLQQNYPHFEIVFVDDGSKDSTYQKVQDAFGNYSNIKILTKPNGGKASALNYGILQTNNPFIICIDADTQLKSDAVTQLMKKMLARQTDGKPVGAVAGNVKVGNENNMITRWQSIEYTTAQNFDRRAFDLINGITVVPGAIGAFRKEAIEKAGGFTSDTLAEDCDLTIRILRNGYRVVNCTEAIAITEAPETIRQFMKQRFRWSYGIMQSFWKNREACFNPAYKGLGMVALPNVLLFQIILPMIAPLADVILVISLIWNHNSPESLHKIELYYLLFFGVDILVSIIAFAFEKENFSKLFWLIPQRLVYRQIMYVILYRSIKKAIKGENQGWNVLKRTGNVKQMIATEK